MRITTRIGWSLLIGLLLISACSSPLIGNADRLSRIQQRGRLIISTDANWAPWSYRLEGEARAAETRCGAGEFSANQLSGYTVAVAVELAARIGVEACFVTPTWEQISGGNWGERWDLNGSGMTIGDDSPSDYLFTQPIAAVPAVFFVQLDDDRLTSISDLSGTTIAVLDATLYERYLERTISTDFTDPVQYLVDRPQIAAAYDDNRSLEVLAGADGRLDAVLTAQMAGLQLIRDGLPIRQLGEPVMYLYSSLTLDRHTSQDNNSLLLRMQELIQQMHADGTLQQLSDTYVGVDVSTRAAAYDISRLGQLP